MAKRHSPTQRDFKHTWFLQEWMQQAGKIQADLMKDLNWSKAKASGVWNGQQYNQGLIDELAPYLNARPFELLLPPSEAFSIRRMREAAVKLAAENHAGPPPPGNAGRLAG